MALTELDAAILGTIIEGIFYGTYVVLFILYLVLRHHNHRVVDAPLALAQIALFCLCTISMGLDIFVGYLQVPDVVDKHAAHELNMASLLTFALIDFLAQMILLYRCWIIWDRRWMIVAVPGLLALATLGGGFVLVGLVISPLRNTDPKKFVWLFTSIGTTAYSISLGVNALTTSLIVTKILSISQEVRPWSDSSSDSGQSFRIVTAMLIESGLLMFAFQLVFVVLFSSGLPESNIISTPITHIYGITPTLLNIRVIMGSAYDKPTEKTRSLRFAHSRGAGTHTGIESTIDIELDGVSNERASDATV